MQNSDQTNSDKRKEFKYYPSDFGVLPATPIHMDLTFDMHEDHTYVTSIFTLINKDKELSKLELDAKNLEIKGVFLYEDAHGKETYHEIPYKYDKDNSKLKILFPNMREKNATFSIRTESICRPTSNILEGLYYDETPKGCPKTQITQCQQWGFQRIVPCFDDMTAKCRYTTTIVADSRYTDMISNGDLHIKKEDIGAGRSKIIYHNHKTPMASYTFFLGVGTYDSYTKKFEYPDGETFMLELLVQKGAQSDAAQKALEMLNNGIMWIYIHTGPKRYSNLEHKQKLWELINKRDALKRKNTDSAASKEDSAEFEETRRQLKDLVREFTHGYKYTGKIYREIAMVNSNIGGMENVGNTTIVANVIMPYKELSDNSFEYMLAVKLHEFYHNINGSEVTGMSPFELWLNEAVTVHVEQQYDEDLFGYGYSRLGTIKSLYAPMIGTFAEDLSQTSMPIIPQGFNTPDELITGVTYVKAPEFVRMVELILSKENFVKALNEYHIKFKHSNATTQDWIDCMQNYTRVDLKKFSELWLKRTGYPTVYVSTLFDGTAYIINLEQIGFKDGKPWQIPIKIALVNYDGDDIANTDKTFMMNDAKMTIRYDKLLSVPAFASISRGNSFYGKIINISATHDELLKQATLDKDIICRYMAFTRIIENEKVRLMDDINQKVSEDFLNTYGKILNDDSLDYGIKAMFLGITDSIMDDNKAHKYKEIYDAKEKIKRAVADRYKNKFLELYSICSQETRKENYVLSEIENIKRRRMKHLSLAFLCVFDNDEIYNLIKMQLASENATDMYAAFMFYLNTTASNRLEVVQKARDRFSKHNVSWESYLKCISSCDREDVIALIKMVEKDPRLDMDNASQQRSLYTPFVMNRKISLLTKEGFDFFVQSLIKLTKINEYTVFNLLPAFAHLDKLKSENQVMIVQGLLKILENISEKEHASIYNNIKRIIIGSPSAVMAFEKQNNTRINIK